MPSRFTTTFKRHSTVAVLAAPCALLACGSAHGLTITPTFDSSITTDPNHVAIENAVNSAIGVYQRDFTNNINVPIDFTEMSSGLGESYYSLTPVNYSDFRNALAAEPTSSVRATALNSLPSQSAEPVAGTTGTQLLLTTANVNAMVASGQLSSSYAVSTTLDGTISLNTSITYPGGAGSPSGYSLETVVMHEIDEVLGLGSALPDYGTTNGLNAPRPEDLYRYAANGTRSFSTSATESVYFSLNGTTDLSQFNNSNNGGDYGDWASNPLPSGASPQVQDAFITGGQNITLGSNEFAALQAIGYVQVPDPAGIALLAAGLAAALTLSTRRKRPRA